MHIALLMRAEPHGIPDRMTIALRAAGHQVDAIAISSPDDARRALHDLPDTAHPLIDAAVLDHFDQLPLQHAAALVHRRPHGKLPPLRCIIATSTNLAEQLADAPTRISVVVPGVDDAPRTTGSGGPGCAILSIGALIPCNGHDLLLRALARLFDLDWSLTIVGTPDRDPVHAAQLAELAIGARVRFAGALDDSALEQLWQRADLFALAARWDAPPTAIASALKRGLPVAITGEAAAVPIVPVHAGVVCPPGDRDQLSRSLRRLIFDPALRRAYADAAFATGGLLPSWSTQAALLAEALR